MNLRPRRREEPEITLTPLIDVVFLMLIFFMVSTTFQRDADMAITLPEAGQQPAERELHPIELGISAEGDFLIDGRSLVNGQLDTIRRALEEARAERPDAPLVIRADARTSHQNVVRAMEAAGQADITRLSFATVPHREDDE